MFSWVGEGVVQLVPPATKGCGPRSTWTPGPPTLNIMWASMSLRDGGNKESGYLWSLCPCCIDLLSGCCMQWRLGSQEPLEGLVQAHLMPLPHPYSHHKEWPVFLINSHLIFTFTSYSHLSAFAYVVLSTWNALFPWQSPPPYRHSSRVSSFMKCAAPSRADSSKPGAHLYSPTTAPISVSLIELQPSLLYEMDKWMMNDDGNYYDSVHY